LRYIFLYRRCLIRDRLLTRWECLFCKTLYTCSITKRKDVKIVGKFCSFVHVTYLVEPTYVNYNHRSVSVIAYQ